MDRLLPRAGRPLDAVVEAPASKSVTHRALVAAALAEGVSTIVRPLDADDIRSTIAGIRALGIEVEASPNGLLVNGCAGRVPGGGTLNLGESGTSLRFLTAVASLGEAPSRIDGGSRLRERPIRPLAEALTALGAKVSCEGLPLTAGGVRFAGGAMRIAASHSSQFTSALMTIGPCLRGGLSLTLAPPIVSRPYIDLTAAVMRDFGADAAAVGEVGWQVGTAPYRARSFTIEGDHSSASYFLAAPLVAAGRVRVERLDPRSPQADQCLPAILEDLGAEVLRGDDWIEVRATGRIPPFDLSLGHAPDLVPTIAVLGLFASGPAVIRDVPQLRFKESDRLEQLAVNIRKLGRTVVADDDRLRIGGHQPLGRAPTIETGGDHRIAMAFAIAGLTMDLRVDDPECVGKSNPGFWADWEALLR